MAVQLMVEEVKGKETYLHWLQRKVGFCSILTRILFETEFTSDIQDDKIQMDKARELRRIYADEVGNGDNKLSDRLWKSIHDPCSVLEMMVYLSDYLNSMVNETEEDWSFRFFYILLENSKMLNFDDEDHDFRPDDVEKFWRSRVKKVVERHYDASGNGGFFPVCGAKFGVGEGQKDMRKVPILLQANAWLEENSDENGEFDWAKNA